MHSVVEHAGRKLPSLAIDHNVVMAIDIFTDCLETRRWQTDFSRAVEIVGKFHH